MHNMGAENRKIFFFILATGGVSSYTQKNGRRITAYNAFIEPILENRPSLQVVKYARVMQVC